MLSGKMLSRNNIDKVQKRCLKIVHEKYDKTIEELLAIKNEQTSHEINIKKLLVDICKKSIYDLNPPVMKEIFKLNSFLLNLPPVKTA